MRFGPKEVDGGERAPQEDSTVQKEALSREGAQLRNRKGKWGQAVMNCGAVAGQPWAEGEKPESWDSCVNHIPSVEEHRPAKETISQISPT